MAADNSKQSASFAAKDILFEMPSLADPRRYIQFHIDRVRVSERLRTSSIDEPLHRKPEKQADAVQCYLPFRVGDKDRIRMPPGLSVMSAITSAGKSSLFRSVAETTAVHRVLAVEPPDTEDERENFEIYNSVDSALIALVRHQLAMNTALPVLDSLREALFEINGPAGAKGIVNAFFTALTRVSNALSSSGISILATVNPMNREKDYLEEFHSKLSSACPGMFILESREQVGGVTKFQGTATFRPDRTLRQWSFSQSGSSIVDPKGGDLVMFDANRARDENHPFFGFAALDLIASMQHPTSIEDKTL